MSVAGPSFPYFFLSRAPGEDDIYIGRFFDDLCAAVRGFTGVDGSVDVGYLDPAAAEAPAWPTDAQTALATCRTFVALCSTRYFLASHCGRSWSVFAERLGAYRRQTGDRCDNLIPLVWADSSLAVDLPLVDGQEVEPHPTPADEELRVLIRLSRHRAAYQAFVVSLARRIVDAAHRHRLPPATAEQELASVPDAFAGHARELVGADRPMRISFTVIAGTRQQMRPVRANLGPYGERREDWAPYAPAVSQPVSDRAVALAAARQIGAEVVPLESIVDHVGAARQRNEVVVLLVDAWATQLDELRAALHEVGRRDDDTAVVLVPTNQEDPETAANRAVLRRAVLAAFRDRPQRRDLTFHPDVSTVDRFDTDLAVALVAAQAKAARAQPAGGAQPSGSPPDRPILRGP